MYIFFLFFFVSFLATVFNGEIKLYNKRVRDGVSTRLKYFRGGVGLGAAVGPTQVARGRLADEAEVAEFNVVAGGVHEQVLELEVAVCHVELVHVADGRRDLRRPQPRAVLADRTCRLDVLQSVAAVGVLEHHVHALPVLHQTTVHGRADGRTHDLRSGVRQEMWESKTPNRVQGSVLQCQCSRCVNNSSALSSAQDSPAVLAGHPSGATTQIPLRAKVGNSYTGRSRTWEGPRVCQWSEGPKSPNWGPQAKPR